MADPQTQSSVPVAYSRIALPAVLDMRAARPLKASLDEICSGQDGCVIAANDVERVSTGCLQVLLSFVRAMNAANRPVFISQSSARFVESVELLGFSKMFAECALEQ